MKRDSLSDSASPFGGSGSTSVSIRRCAIYPGTPLAAGVPFRMTTDPVERLNVLPLTDDSFSREDMLRSKLFGDEFDRAIIGTTVNEHHRRVIIYDEEILIDLMVEQLREDADDGNSSMN
jgi:hypothetical protein